MSKSWYAKDIQIHWKSLDHPIEIIPSIGLLFWSINWNYNWIEWLLRILQINLLLLNVHSSDCGIYGVVYWAHGLLWIVNGGIFRGYCCCIFGYGPPVAINKLYKLNCVSACKCCAKKQQNYDILAVYMFLLSRFDASGNNPFFHISTVPCDWSPS